MTQHLFVQPTDVEALVDFDLDEPTAVSVNIYRSDGQRAGHTERTAGDRYFSHWFTGLRPDTDYRIEVLTQAGWGGFSGFGFRTEALKQSTAVQEASRLIRSSPELVEYCLSVANKVPDRRMVPALLQWIRSDHPSVAAQMKKAAWVAEKTRSRELAGELAKRSINTDDEQLARYVLNAMAHTRHPDAPAYGRRLLGKWSDGDAFVNAVKCLAVAPSPALLTELEPLVKRYREVTRVVEWLVRCDRPASQALFRRLLAGSDHTQGSMTQFGCEGLAFLHDDADVPLLESIVDLGDAKDFGRAFAIRALVTFGSPAARAAIARALSRSPTCPELVCAAGFYRITELAPVVGSTFQVSTGRLKKEAACALGLLGDATFAPALIAALDDRAPEVRDAAAWALGRMNAAGSAIPLRDHAVKSAAGDGPLFALGLIASPEATAKLALMLEDPIVATDRSRSALVDWARRRSTGARLAPGEYPLFGGAAYDRVDLELEPGDVIKASVTGTWRFGGNKDDTPSRTQVMSNGTRACARACVGDQVLFLEQAPTYYLLRRGGDVQLTPRDWPPIHLNGIPSDEPRGFALVHLEPQS